MSMMKVYKTMGTPENEVRIGPGGPVEFYNDAFLANGYFPDLVMTDVMEMYPTPDKNPAMMEGSTGPLHHQEMAAHHMVARKRKEPMEDRELPEDVKQIR